MIGFGTHSPQKVGRESESQDLFALRERVCLAHVSEQTMLSLPSLSVATTNIALMSSKDLAHESNCAEGACMAKHDSERGQSIRSNVQQAAVVITRETLDLMRSKIQFKP